MRHFYQSWPTTQKAVKFQPNPTCSAKKKNHLDQTHRAKLEHGSKSHQMSIIVSGGRGGQLPLPKFEPVGKKNFCWGIFFQQYEIWGWKSPILWTFKGEIKILSTHNLPCRKFAASVGQLQLLVPNVFNTRRGCQMLQPKNSKCLWKISRKQIRLSSSSFNIVHCQSNFFRETSK